MKGLVTSLRAYTNKTIEDAERGVETTRDIQYNESRRRIAVDSGDTRSDITKTPVRRRGSEISAEVFTIGMVPVWLEYGTGIHSVNGGSRAKKIPWTYYKDGRFITTYGMQAQPFWYPSLDVTRQYFKNYFSN